MSELSMQNGSQGDPSKPSTWELVPMEGATPAAPKVEASVVSSVTPDALGVPSVPYRAEPVAQAAPEKSIESPIQSPIQNPQQGPVNTWQQTMPQGGYAAPYSTWMPQAPQTEQVAQVSTTPDIEAAPPEPVVVAPEAAYSNMRVEPTLGEANPPKPGERNVEAEAAAADNLVRGTLGNESRARYERMTPRAKGLFGRFIESVKQAAPTRWLVEKMEYDESKAKVGKYERKIKSAENWASERQKEFEKYRDEVYSFNADIAKKEQEILLGGTGTAQLQLEVRKLKEDREKAKSKMEKYAEKVEWKETHMRAIAADRDRVAREYIERADERIAPAELHIKSQERARAELGLRLKLMKMQHKNAELELSHLQEEQMGEMDSLRKMGVLSEKQIAKHALVVLAGEKINERRAKMAAEREEVESKVADIEKEIKRSRARINPHVVRRDEFIVITEKKPIKFASGNIDRLNAVHRTTRMTEGAAGQVPAREAERAPGQLEGVRSLGTMLLGWNNFTEVIRSQKATIDPTIAITAIDSRDFIETLGTSADTQLTMPQFAELIEEFYNFRGLSHSGLDRAFAAFNKLENDNEAAGIA